MSESQDAIYSDISESSEDPTVTQIESMCMTCRENGFTRLLLTKIPHYKEVIVTSFTCESCGNTNSGIQEGNIQEKGVHFELKVKNEDDLGRQVVKSSSAVVTIPEVQLEIPAERGEVTTVEGIIRRTVEDLGQDQEARQQLHPDLAQQITTFLIKLTGLLTLQESFTVIVDDPSGNSHMESLHAPNVDPQLTYRQYRRDVTQESSLGFCQKESDLNGLDSVEEAEDEEEEREQVGEDLSEDQEEEADDINDVVSFSTLCDKCGRPTETKMKVVQIPYFKEVVVMAMHCDACGNRNNEVKSGAGIGEKGRKIKLRITDPTDMARDVLKSDTCSLEIPELEIYVGGGILGGKFTTLEGLVNNIRDNLLENPFLIGDSVQGQTRDRANQLLSDLDKVTTGEMQVHIILDDPTGNSYLQNVYAPEEDPEMEVEEYERSHQQNEDLGVNDMNTENYEREA